MHFCRAIVESKANRNQIGNQSRNNSNDDEMDRQPAISLTYVRSICIYIHVNIIHDKIYNSLIRFDSISGPAKRDALSL